MQRARSGVNVGSSRVQDAPFLSFMFKERQVSCGVKRARGSVRRVMLRRLRLLGMRLRLDADGRDDCNQQQLDHFLHHLGGAEDTQGCRALMVTLHDAEAGGSGHRFGINALASSPDGQLFTAGRDGTVRCWSLGAQSSDAERQGEAAG